MTPEVIELPKLDKGDIPCISTNTANRSFRLKKQTFSFNKTTQREVYETILKIDPSKGPGVDNLDVKATGGGPGSKKVKLI